MAKERAVTGCQDGRDVAGLEVWGGVADAIHPPEDTMERAASEPSPDLGPAQAR
jgi:hypothetical protein